MPVDSRQSPVRVLGWHMVREHAGQELVGTPRDERVHHRQYRNCDEAAVTCSSMSRHFASVVGDTLVRTTLLPRSLATVQYRVTDASPWNRGNVRPH